MLRCEISITRNDGVLISCQLHGIAVTIENKADYILTSISDCTVRKQLEEKLRTAHDKLEQTVRGLETVIERAVITSQGTALQVLDRFDTFWKTVEHAVQDVKGLADLERDHILQVLRKTAWRIEGKNGAALLLGLNPSILRARIRKYGILRQ